MSVPAFLVAQGINAGLGAIGSHSAAQAQEAAAKQAQDIANRQYVNSLYSNEPGRQLGYNAMNDINAEFGYNPAPYTSANQLVTNANPITSKFIKHALKGGASFNQVAGMGTLGQLGDKAIKRLTKAGLTIDQIHALQNGQAAAASGPQVQGAPNAGPAPQGHGFMASPDYAFRRDQGQQDIGNSFAARGGAASGNALKALTELNQNLASSEYGNWFNRRAQLAGLGQGATQANQQAGQNYAGMAGQSAMAQGDARASGVMGAANSIGGAINSGLNGYLFNKYLNGGGGVGSSGSYNAGNVSIPGFNGGSAGNYAINLPWIGG